MAANSSKSGSSKAGSSKAGSSKTGSSKTWTDEQIKAIMKRAESECEDLDLEDMRSKAKYRVNMRRALTKKQIARKGKYEMKRIDNIGKNMSLKYFIG